jgi:ATP-dependent DNA helicase HMI1
MAENGASEKSPLELPTGPRLGTHVVTDAQNKVINFAADEDSVLVVNAGPGSGKTSTLVRRIAKLAAQYDPSEILVLSMANRSVNSIRDNLQNLFKTDGNSHPDVFTFHSFCSLLLDENSTFLANRVLVDDFSWRSFSKIFLSRPAMDYKAAAITPSKLEQILQAVKSGTSIEEQAKKHNVSPEYIGLVLDYLKANKMIRYNDLIVNAMEMLSLTRDIARLTNYKIVVVDEFQDMYPQLLSLVKAVVAYPTAGRLGLAKKHLTVAGDPNQTIYEFLGSDPNLLHDIGTYLNMSVTELSLGESFRCTPEILQVASKVGLSSAGLLTSNSTRSLKPPGIKPVLLMHKSSREEHDFIASEITRLICVLGGLLVPSDFAILTRANRELDEISHSILQNYGYSCNRFSLSASWIKSRVHLLLDLLFLLNGGMGLNFALLCLLPRLDRRAGNSRRISRLFHMSNSWNSEAAGGRLEDYLRQELGNLDGKPRGKYSILNVYKGPENRPFLEATKKLLHWTDKTREVAAELTPLLILKSLLTVTSELDLLDYLNKPESSPRKSGADADSRAQAELENNLDGFYKSLCACHKSFMDDMDTSTLFLEYFLRNYNDEPPILDRNMINISTVHTAKGLEFPVVFIAGVKDTYASFWSSLMNNEGRHDEEKARLFYVACTRARSLLYMSALKPVGPEIRHYFRTNLPSSSELMSSIAREGYRPLPTAEKVNQGINLYKEITRLGLISGAQRRHIHTGRCLVKLTQLIPKCIKYIG